MTDDSPQDAWHEAAEDAVDDERTFEAALNALIRAAARNGIDLDRSWTCRNEPQAPDWEVRVVAVDRSESARDPE